MQYECISAVKKSDLETTALQSREKHGTKKSSIHVFSFTAVKQSSLGLAELAAFIMVGSRSGHRVR